MWAIIKKDLGVFFTTPIGYIVVGLFLLANGMFLWVLPGQYNVLDGGYANVDGLFSLAPWLLLFLIPAITMRAMAEEYQTGTVETLLTKPVEEYKVVCGKWLASWVLVVVALLPTLLWYFIVGAIAEPAYNVDGGAFWGSWLGLLMLSMLYTAIGIFGSSLTKSQILAFVVSAVVSFLLYYGFELAGGLTSGTTAYTLQSFGIAAHYSSISRGVLDSRDVVYYLLTSAVFLWLAVYAVKRR